MKDPKCPHCDTPASEHEDNQCFDAWLDYVKHGPRQETWGHEIKKPPKDRYAWFDGKLQIRYVYDFSDWQNSGPLLEEMMEDINKVVFMRGLVVPQYAIRFYSDIGNEVRAETFTHVICRAFLVWNWKANQNDS